MCFYCMKKKHSKKNGVKIRYNGHKIEQKQGIRLEVYIAFSLVSVGESSLRRNVTFIRRRYMLRFVGRSSDAGYPASRFHYFLAE